MTQFISVLSKLKAPAVIAHRFEPTTANIVSRIPGSTEVLLIGEATHGSLEFYETRAEVTKSLIKERGYHAVAVEAGKVYWSCTVLLSLSIRILGCLIHEALCADFPDAFRANLWARGLSKGVSAEGALADFAVSTHDIL